MLDYLSDNPTETDILKAVYEVKPKFDSKRARELLGPKRNREVDQETFNQLPSLMGQVPQNIPEEIRENIRFAEEKLRKLKLMN